MLTAATSLLGWLTSGVQRRVVKFLLKRTVGQWVTFGGHHHQPAEINLLDNGHVEVRGLKLRRGRGSIDSVRVDVPWVELMSGEAQAEVTVQGLAVRLDVDKGGGDAMPTSPGNVSIDDTEFYNDALHDEEEEDLEGLSLVQDLIDRMVAQVRVTLVDVRVTAGSASVSIKRATYQRVTSYSHKNDDSDSADEHVLNFDGLDVRLDGALALRCSNSPVCVRMSAPSHSANDGWSVNVDMDSLIGVVHCPEQYRRMLDIVSTLVDRYGDESDLDSETRWSLRVGVRTADLAILCNSTSSYEDLDCIAVPYLKCGVSEVQFTYTSDGGVNAQLSAKQLAIHERSRTHPYSRSLIETLAHVTVTLQNDDRIDIQTGAVRLHADPSLGERWRTWTLALERADSTPALHVNFSSSFFTIVYNDFSFGVCQLRLSSMERLSFNDVRLAMAGSEMPLMTISGVELAWKQQSSPTANQTSNGVHDSLLAFFTDHVGAAEWVLDGHVSRVDASITKAQYHKLMSNDQSSPAQLPRVIACLAIDQCRLQIIDDIASYDAQLQGVHACVDSNFGWYCEALTFQLSERTDVNDCILVERTLPTSTTMLRFTGSAMHTLQVHAWISNITWTYEPDWQWLRAIGQFFSSAVSSADNKRSSTWTVNFSDTSLFYASNDGDGQLVWGVDSVSIKGNSSSYTFHWGDVRIFLLDNDDACQPVPNTLALDSVRTFWALRGLVDVGVVTDLEMSYNVDDGTADLRVSGDVSLRLHADSAPVLIDIVPRFFGGSDTEASKNDRHHPSPPIIALPNDMDIMFDIDEEAFARPLRPTQHRPSSPLDMDFIDDYYAPPRNDETCVRGDIDESFFEPDSWEAVPEPKRRPAAHASLNDGDLVRVLDLDDEFEIIEDYYTSERTLGDAPTPDIGLPKFRIVLSGCNVRVQCFSGRAWRQTATSSSARTSDIAQMDDFLYDDPAVEIVWDEQSQLGFSEREEASSFGGGSETLMLAPLPSAEMNTDRVDFEALGVNLTYASHGNGDSQIVLTVQDFSVDDHVRTSRWRKCVMALQPKFVGDAPLRTTGQPMVTVEISGVHSNNGIIEHSMNVRCLPLRLHVDQDTADFMRNFFSFSHDDRSTASYYPYIQYASLGPFQMTVDYKPKRLNYQRLGDGHLSELLNMFRLERAEVVLKRVRISGVSGWSRLAQQAFTEHWLPDLLDHQLPGLATGLLPIRAAVNISSGLAELVVMPYEQYQRDGRVWRGVQRGARQFVRSTAMETLDIGARLAVGAHGVLERVERQLAAASVSPEQASPSKFANAPRSLSEGVERAVRTLHHSIKDSVYVVASLPVRERRRTVRNLPVVVLKPAMGMSLAMRDLLLGLRASLDPTSAQHLHDKYK